MPTEGNNRPAFSEWPELVRFGPDAIGTAARHLRNSGLALIFADSQTDAGFLPPALPGECLSALAATDAAGYLLRRRIARAVASRALSDSGAVAVENTAIEDPVVGDHGTDALEIVTMPGGAPAFSGVDTGLHLSFTSREGISLIGIARQPIGVDLELVAELTMLPLNILRSDEIQDIMALPEDRRIARFLELWTMKEAILKAMGIGFTIPPEALRIADDQTITICDRDGRWRAVEARIRICCSKSANSDASIGFPHLTIALALLSRTPQ